MYTIKRYNPFISALGKWIVIALVVFSVSCSGQHTGDIHKEATGRLPVADMALSVGDAFKKWPHEKSDLRPDPAVVFGRLENGFRYVLLENKEPKDRVSMHLDVQVGSLHESDGQQGLAHFLEHMLFNGSSNFKPGELVKYFQSIGMQFGPDANAHTSFRETVYDILLPEGSKESLEEGLVVMKDFAAGALLLQSEIDKERRVVLAEKRTRDSASYRTYVSATKFEFPETRLSKRFPIGLEEVLKNADRKQVKTFYDTWYRPEEMILVAVGDFDTKVLAALITKKFAPLSSRAPPRPVPDIGAINHQGLKVFYHFEQETGNTQISIEIVRKVPSRPDSFAFQKKLLLTDIADRIVQNRLDAMVSKPDVPFTSASISSGFFLNEVKYAEITAESSPKDWDKSLALIEQTLRRALDFGFAQSELKRVKKDFLAELDNAAKQATTRNSRNLAREIIWALNADRVFMSPEQEKTLFSPLIESLTLKEVYEAFRQNWVSDHKLILVTGNANLNGRQATPEHQIRSVYDKSNKVKVSRPPAAAPVKFPYLPEPAQKGRIIHRLTIPDLGIVQVDFDNGVRLNLKKTDFEANEVLVNLAFGEGRSCEPADKSGLADLSTRVINESGLGRLTKDELDRAMAGKNTTVDFGIGEDRFYFKGKTTTDEVSLLFQLLYAHLIDPGFREDAYTLSMERYRQEYRRLSSTIEGALLLAGRRFLAGGDSRFGMPPYEEFKRLSLDDIRSWYHKSLATADIEVSIVGDFKVASLIETASKYLGSLAPNQKSEQVINARRPAFPVNQSLEIPFLTEIPKGLVVVAYPTEDLWDIKRTRRLTILADVVSERLRVQIREKMGSAYATFAFNRPSRAYPRYGTFQIMVYVDPQEADMIVGAVRRLVSELVQAGVSQNELQRAIAPTLTGIKDMLRKNTYWLNTVLKGSEQYPQKIDWSRTIMQDYASISKEEVAAMAGQYLDNRRAAVIVVKPASKK